MLELSVKLRKEKGHQNKKVREQGLVPAVLYGRGVENVVISVNARDFEKVYKEAGSSALIQLKIDDASKEQVSKDDTRVVLIQDATKNVVSGEIIHIDFNQVKMDEETQVEIPLVFIGKSMAVERESGVLVKNIQTIEIKALPQNLPKQIEVDISIIKTFNDNLRVKDLKIPENVKITTANQEDIIASVVPPRTSEELEELKEAPTESVEEVEVEKKGKEKEEEVQEGGSTPEEKKSADGGESN